MLVVVWQFLPFKSTLGDRERKKKEYCWNSQITGWYHCLENFFKKMDKIENFLKEPSMEKLERLRKSEEERVQERRGSPATIPKQRIPLWWAIPRSVCGVTEDRWKNLSNRHPRGKKEVSSVSYKQTEGIYPPRRTARSGGNRQQPHSGRGGGAHGKRPTPQA